MEEREGYEGTVRFVGGSLAGSRMDFYDAVPDRDKPITTATGDVYEFRPGDDWTVYARADQP